MDRASTTRSMSIVVPILDGACPASTLGKLVLMLVSPAVQDRMGHDFTDSKAMCTDSGWECEVIGQSSGED